MNFPKNASKQQKALFKQYVAHFVENNIFFLIYPLLLIWSKTVLLIIQIFLRICPFSNIVRKTNFLSISVLDS